LVGLTSGALIRSMNEKATSSTSATAQTTSTNQATPAIESHLIKIPMELEKPAIAPDGVIKDNILYLNINSQVPVTGGSFEELITEQLKENKPVILAVATTKVNDVYNYHIYEAATTKWFYGNDFRRNRYMINADQPLEPTNRQPIINKILFFILYDKNKPIEYLGSDYDLFQGTDDQRQFLYTTLVANDDNPDAMAGLGGLYKKQNKLDLAEQYFKQASNKDHVVAINNLAYLYQQQNKLDLAERYYKQAANKDNLEAMINLGILYINQKRFDEAEQCFKQAATKGYVDAELNLGELYAYQNKFDLAEHFYKQAADKDNLEAISNLGALYLQQNRLYEAEQRLKQAAAKGNVDALFRLGILYDKQDKLDLAEQYFKQAVDKDHVLAIISLGYVYIKQKRFDEAEQHDRQVLQALQLKPNPELEAKINQQLAIIAKKKSEVQK